MLFLRTLISAARMIRYAPQLTTGLPPDDEVLLDAPDVRLSPALAAAGAGGFTRAAALLAAAREDGEWESRDRWATRLAVFAESRSGWLSDWLAAAPDDPDAALVRAQVAVRRAWRRPDRAERLRETAPLIARAADATPRDPVPWRLALDHARGTAAHRPAFDACWEEAVRRAPRHYGCHVAAVRYLGRHGTYASEALDFAEHAAAQTAPAGSLLPALPLRAAFDRPAEVSRRRIDAAADLAIGLSGGCPPGDPRPAEVRNLLAYVLTVQGRWAEALEEFRRIGPHATAFPWDRISDDPLGRFLTVREGVRVRVAATLPLRRRRAAGALTGGDAVAGPGPGHRRDDRP